MYKHVYVLLPSISAKIMKMHSTPMFTHCGRNVIHAIMQLTFSNAFCWMKIYECRLRFRWSLLPRVQLTIFQHWLWYWLGADQATNHYLNQWWIFSWRIYTSSGSKELRPMNHHQIHLVFFRTLMNRHMFKSLNYVIAPMLIDIALKRT